MPLDALRLANSFRDLSTNRPVTIDAAADRWAAAYSGYASQATALDAQPAVLPTQLLKQSFAGAMQRQTFLLELPIVLTAFWMSPPVIFAGPTTTGPVSAIVGASILLTGITAFAAENALGISISSEFPLDRLAGLLDAFTHTVLVQLINTASGTTLPTNLL